MAEAETGIDTVISDFGGVLTTPLVQSFMAFQDETGISTENLGKAMAALADEHGENPLFHMERGEITEPEFLELLSGGLEPLLGHRPALHRFKEIYFEALDPNAADDRADARAQGRGLHDGDADQQREGVGAAVAPDASGRRDLRHRRRLRLRRLPQARIEDLHADPGADRSRCRTLPVRRRPRGQLRGRPPSRHARRPVPRQRAGDSGDPDARSASSCRSRRGPRCRARPPRRRAPSGAAARAGRAPAPARRPR